MGFMMYVPCICRMPGGVKSFQAAGEKSDDMPHGANCYCAIKKNRRSLCECKHHVVWVYP